VSSFQSSLTVVEFVFSNYFYLISSFSLNATGMKFRPSKVFKTVQLYHCPDQLLKMGAVTGTLLSGFVFILLTNTQ